MSAALRIATVLLPEPRPPVTRRWPLVAMICCCLSLGCIRPCPRAGTGNFSDACFLVIRGRERASRHQPRAGVPQPFGTLFLRALREKIGDAPGPLRPSEIFAQR